MCDREGRGRQVFAQNGCLWAAAILRLSSDIGRSQRGISHKINARHSN